MEKQNNNLNLFIEKMKENLELLKNKKIPNNYPEDITSSDNHYAMMKCAELSRENFIKNSTYPLVSNDWIEILSDYLKDEKCLEISAKSGMISFALKKNNIDILPTESGDEKWNNWTDVIKLSPLNAIQEYIKERPYVILSWPDSSAYAYTLFMFMKTLNSSSTMIYIGEVEENSDFSKLKEIDQNISKKMNEKFLSWCGTKDYIRILR